MLLQLAPSVLIRRDLLDLHLSPGCEATSPLRNLYSRLNSKRERRSSSVFSINPSGILSVLVDVGGLIIPQDVEEDIDIIRECLYVKDAELNMVQKHVVLYDCQIGLQNQTLPALRVGRIFVRWDSFRKPCVEIEVNGIDITVEFTNLRLTRSNWNELVDFGFPPFFEEKRKGKKQSRSPKRTRRRDVENAFILFNNIDLSGNITLQLASRPLEKTIGRMSLDMNATDDLGPQIQSLSEWNLRRSGRKGCTPKQLTDLLQSYFSEKIKTIIPKSVQFIAEEPREALQMAGRLLDGATEYAGEAVEMARENSHDAFESRWSKLRSAFTNRFRPSNSTNNEYRHTPERIQSVFESNPDMLKLFPGI